MILVISHLAALAGGWYACRRWYAKAIAAETAIKDTAAKVAGDVKDGAKKV